MTYNEKQKEYTMNYMKEKLDEIKFRVPKGQKAIIREHAEKQGEKLTPFIVRAINETIARDNLSGSPQQMPENNSPQKPNAPEPPAPDIDDDDFIPEFMRDDYVPPKKEPAPEPKPKKAPKRTLSIEDDDYIPPFMLGDDDE